MMHRQSGRWHATASRVIRAATLLWLGAMGGLNPAEAADTVFVPLGATWRYLDDGSDQGTAWPAPGFNDASWASGPAQLGYGDGDEATVVSYGPNASNKFITTYFRHAFTVTNAASYPHVALQILRDDGAVVYLNGTEVFRTNMPGGPVSFTTPASSAVGGSDESALFSASIDPALLVDGTNVLAVEIHQSSGTSSDISFDLTLTGAALERGPYLQLGTPTSVVVRWRTAAASDSRVRYGTSVDNLNLVADDAVVTTEHEVHVAGLAPDTTYFYAVGTSTQTLAGGDLDHFFTTAPPSGIAKDTRIWVLGDSGTANSNARAVRDAYEAFTGTRGTDLWLMLGDNAYSSGTDSQYQAAVFDMYPRELRTSVLWPTLGNHDGISADSASQSGPYYDMFTLPTQAEAGGLASGTEAYYSFDYANIHFVCLDSHETDRSPTGAMMTWMDDDLMATNADWIIAFWHHPPYSKGSHNSDTETQLIQMRENALPILEAHGVDLVLAGHSHSYERSMLIDSHYGLSSTLDGSMILDGGDGRIDGNGAYEKATLGPAPHEGAVYVVAGSSGQVSGGSLNHPVMYISLATLGSVVLDVNGSVLNAKFIAGSGAVSDYFTIVKGAAASPTATATATYTNTAVPTATATMTETPSATATATNSPTATATNSPTATGTNSPTATQTSTPSLTPAPTDTPPSACDNDGVCEAGEDCTNCPNDCPTGSGTVCGNGVCEAGGGEDCVSCSQDCNGKQNGKPSGRFCCGDGDGANPLPCSDVQCTAGGAECTDTPVAPSCCGDGTCTGDESSATCALDCGPAPVCGDGSCQPEEDSCSCAADCGAPPPSEVPNVSCTDGKDNDCDAAADCLDVDCGSDPACAGSCGPGGAPCTQGSECCSSKCRGKPGARTCQ